MQLVTGTLNDAVSQGANVVRAWTHPVSAANAMETSPGQYRESVLRGLDYLLDEARQRGLRLLLVLIDNWQVQGVDTLVQWAGGGSLVHEDFFTDERVKQLYKGRVSTILNRVNSINGRAYKDDPTIFAWDLINEPRCYKCGGAVASWIAEMAAYVKSIDGNHLVTVGEEGFYAAGQPGSYANPQGAGSWAEDEGQNFLADHASADVDFAAFHFWPDNWEDEDPNFVDRWINQHLADAATLNKPVLLEEFGKYDANGSVGQRNTYYQRIYRLMDQSAQGGGASAGALFWLYFAKGQVAPASEGGGPGGRYGVFGSDTTFSIIAGFTQDMKALSGNTAPGCSAATVAAASMPAPQADCSHTRVKGRPGTG